VRKGWLVDEAQVALSNPLLCTRREQRRQQQSQKGLNKSTKADVHACLLSLMML
jgi:hypothetical protein